MIIRDILKSKLLDVHGITSRIFPYSKKANK